ncbi:hypothetical protein MED134_06809 [Dokdonia sp. MED134]|uniref:DUF6686 family protein n=1 Tax=Dokdonia sp. MED134 TaxID=313590 RepID=UPI0002D72C03|nr:DUF6686 family protein [Dokdonia sp. MED134]EAQ40445.3 hypothetical protein MED134_06809 [Dokdonia sp. MED134]
MCTNLKTLSKNIEGELSYCKGCRVYHLYFNNIYLQFTPREFKAFTTFVFEIDVAYWEASCQRALLKRKIPIQSMQQNLAMVFNQSELNALKDLLKIKTKTNRFLKPYEIDYTSFLN